MSDLSNNDSSNRNSPALLDLKDLYKKIQRYLDYTNNPTIYAVYASVRYIILLYLFYNWSIKPPNKTSDISNPEYTLISWKSKIYNTLIDLNDWWEYQLKLWGGYYANDTYDITVKITDWNQIPNENLTPEQIDKRNNLNYIVEKQNSLIFYNWWIYLQDNADMLFDVFRILFFLSLGLNNLITYQELLENAPVDINNTSNKNQTNPYSKYVKSDFFTLITLICITAIAICAGWLFIYLSINFTYVGFIYDTILSILIIIGFSGIIYYMFKNDTKIIRDPNDKSWINLFIRIILYIPCEITNITDYINKQYKLTNKPILILLVVEIILITLRFVVPLINTYVNEKTDVFTLLKSPVYLDHEYTLKNTNKIYNSVNNVDYNYSIAFWFSINPQSNSSRPNTNTPTNILKMGIANNTNPSIEYTASKNTLNIYSCNNKSNSDKSNSDKSNSNKSNSNKSNSNKSNTSCLLYTTNDLKYQKWNYLVLNYQSGLVDVFLNGELRNTTTNVQPRLLNSDIIIGEMNGVQGGITDIVYRKFILSPKEIRRIYKTSNLI
mgnify:CR=1 FL=1